MNRLAAIGQDTIPEKSIWQNPHLVLRLKTLSTTTEQVSRIVEILTTNIDGATSSGVTEYLIIKEMRDAIIQQLSDNTLTLTMALLQSSNQYAQRVGHILGVNGHTKRILEANKR